MKDGVSFSINTDDPGVQQSTLIDDYQIASKSFLFSIQQLHSTVSLCSRLVLKSCHAKVFNIY